MNATEIDEELCVTVVPLDIDAVVPQLPALGARATTANKPDYAENDVMNNEPLTLSVASVPANTKLWGNVSS
jgi:hypothetical protein